MAARLWRLGTGTWRARVGTLALIALVVAYALALGNAVLDRNRLAALMDDDVWAVYQLQFEHQRTLGAAALAELPGSGAGREELGFRLDILASRIAILEQGIALENLRQDPGDAAEIARIAAAFREADALFQAAPDEALPRVAREIRAILGAPDIHPQTLTRHAIEQSDELAERQLEDIDDTVWLSLFLLAVVIFGGVAATAFTVRHYDQVEASEAQLSMLTNVLPVLLMYADREQRYRYVSKRFEDWYGIGVERILGLTVLELVGERNYAILEPYIARALAGEAVEWEAELSYPTGQGRQVHGWYEPHRGPTGEVEGYFALVEDVTERKSTEERLRQAQKLEVVGQLTGGFAHDFNNLLTVVLGSLELAEGSGRLAPAEARLVRNATSAAERGALLTHRLLAFARRQMLQPRAVDVAQLTIAMREALTRAAGTGVSIRVSAESGLWPCHVDPAQLEAALLNLAINAREAMPEGGEFTIHAANVRVDASMAADSDLAPGAYVVIDVTDTGRGIPPEILGQVFEPFFTTKDIGEGSGLGLSMVQGFVRQSGGHVRIASEVGKGTSVKLYLPREAEQAKSEPAANPPAPAQSVEPRARIVVVEDDPAILSFVVESLTRLGYRVEAAADGRAALDLLDRLGDARLLFCDVVLPGGMDGFEVAAEARRRWPHLAVLLTSGYPERNQERAAKSDFPLLFKPYRRAALTERVAELLGEAKPS